MVSEGKRFAFLLDVRGEANAFRIKRRKETIREVSTTKTSKLIIEYDCRNYQFVLDESDSLW